MSQKFLSDVTLSTVTAGSMLKLDANGKIVEAVDGTDYISTSSTSLWTSTNNGIYYSDDVRIGTYTNSVAPSAKLHVFDYQTTDPKLLIEDGNTGDASMEFKISTQSYTMGIDNSDSDKFVLAASSALGTTNILEVATNGTAAFQTGVLFNTTVYMPGSGQTSDREALINAHGTRAILYKQGNAAFWQVAQGGNQFEIVDAANGNSTKGNVMLRVSGNDVNDNQLHLALNGGKVGINTSSPTTSLDVSGVITTRNSSLLRRYVSTWTNADTHDILYNGWTETLGDYVYLKAQGNSTGGHGMMLVGDNVAHIGRSDVETGAVTGLDQTWATFKNGGVGIGSTEPAAKLNVASTGANAYSSTITKGTNMKGIINALSNNADDMVGIYFGTGTTSEGTHWSGITGSRSQSATDWSTQLNFYTHDENLSNINDATQKMVIKGNGNVGIGTTNPGGKLHLEGDFESGKALVIKGTYGTDTEYYFRTHGTNSEFLSLYAAGVQVMNWKSNRVDTYQGLNILGGAITTGTSNHLVIGSSVQIGQGDEDPVIEFKHDTISLGKIDQFGDIHAGGFKVSGTTGFLKSDGSVDTSTYVASSALSSYLPLTGGTITGDLTIGDGINGSNTNAYSAFDQLIFDNSFNSAANGPNKIVMHDNGSGWQGGFGIHSSTVAYYTGDSHKWYKSASGPGGYSYSQNMALDGSGNLALTGSLTATGYNSTNWDTAHGWGDHSGLYDTVGTAASEAGDVQDNLDSLSGSLGTAAYTASTDYATAAQGLLADSALQSLPSHNHDDRYYTESEMQAFFKRGYISSQNANNLPVGWYTIAQNSGDRALAEFQIWDTASSRHQSVIFSAAHHFGIDDSNSITVLANSSYGTDVFQYIRIKENSTYDGAAIQVYIDNSTNGVGVAIIGGNAQVSGWELVGWLADAESPTAFTGWDAATEKSRIHLDNIHAGGIATTGKIYAGGATTQYRVLTTNDEGTGNGLDADTVDGVQASQFLRSDTPDVMEMSTSSEMLTLKNNTSGQPVQIGLRTNDSDANHHRAYIKASKSSAGNAAGKLELIIRSSGGGTTDDVFVLEAGKKAIWQGANLATESYVSTAISNLVDSAPAALDTLNELAAALGDDASFSTTMSTALGNRLRIDINNQSLSSTELTNARTNLGLGTAATSAATDFVAVSGDTMTGKLKIDTRLQIGDDTSSSTDYIYDGYVDGNSAYFHQPKVIIRSDSSATGGIDEAPVALAMFNRNGTNDTWVKMSFASREASDAGNTVSIAGIAAKKTSGVANSWASGELHLFTKNGASFVTNMVLTNNGNVGIGSTNPQQKLDVDGNITSTGWIAANNYVSTPLFYNSGNHNTLNKAGTGWISWAARDTSGTETVINLSSIGTFSSSGNVGIRTTSPAAPLDVQPASNYKVTKVGDDTTSHYKFTGQVRHTLTLASGSYYSAEVVITAHQTNGGTNNNLYIRGIWTNNHTSHHWHEIENIGGLSGSSFTITNGQSGETEASGELEIFHDYTSGSFGQMVVRVIEHYGTHSYTIS